MLVEDLNAKLVERAELVAEKEEMDQLYEEIKVKYAKEIEFIYKEMELKVQIQHKRETIQKRSTEKKKISLELEETDSRQFELNENIFEANKLKKKLIVASDKTNQEISKDLEEIKLVLTKQALEFNTKEIINIHAEALLLYNESFPNIEGFDYLLSSNLNDLSPERKMENVRQVIFARLNDELKQRRDGMNFTRAAELIENTFLIFIDCLERRIFLSKYFFYGL
jgi:hypothetical protein